MKRKNYEPETNYDYAAEQAFEAFQEIHQREPNDAEFQDFLENYLEEENEPKDCVDFINSNSQGVYYD